MKNIEYNTSRFVEYELFEPDSTELALEQSRQKEAFRKGEVTNPIIDYPQLEADNLIALDSRFDVEISGEEDGSSKNKLSNRQKGLKIAIASALHNQSETHTDRWVNGNEITISSENRYGEIKPELFTPLLVDAHEEVARFIPGDNYSMLQKRRLLEIMPILPEAPEADGSNALDLELLSSIQGQAFMYLEPILSTVPEHGSFSPEDIAGMAEESLSNVGLDAEGWTVVLNPKTKLFSVKKLKKQVIIPNPPQLEGETYTKDSDDIRRLFAHEIGVHAMRREPMGADFEEGVGLLMECAVTGSIDGIAVKRAKNRYFNVGLAAGIDGIKRNARQVFEITWRLEALRAAEEGIITEDIESRAKVSAQAHIDNIFRGTDYKLPGVYYNKAKIYYEGLIEAVSYAREKSSDDGWIENLINNGK